MNLRAIVVLLALLAAVACSSPASEAPAATPWGEATVVEELSIGVEFGADEYMFGYVHSIAVGADGTIYVSDRQQNIVRRYDGDGVFVRDIGGQGQGPGEYGSAPMLGVLPDGTLAIQDRSTSRTSFFAQTGQYLAGFPSVRGGGFVVDRKGNTNAQRFDDALVTYSREGEELGRVALPPQDRAGAQTFVLAFGEGDIYPFPTVTRSVWSPLGYLVTGRNDIYDIELRRPEGTIHLQREIDRPPVNSEEQAEWEAFRRGLEERVRVQTPDIEFEPIPDVKPYFREIHVADDGRIWVWRYVAAVKRDDIEPVPERPDRTLLTWREPWTYDVFEPDGTFLGSVVVPELFRPFVFRGSQIWGALVGEDGLERVVRLRVVPEVR